MRQFQKTLEDLQSRVASAETTTTTWTTPPSASEASDQVQHLQRLRDKMTTAGALLDDCNEQQGYAMLFLQNSFHILHSIAQWLMQNLFHLTDFSLLTMFWCRVNAWPNWKT